MSINLRRERLESPLSFYERAGVLSGRKRMKKSRGWLYGNCPFHKSSSGTSFAINIDSGGYYCFGCGERGGDIIDFVKRRDGLSFKEAAMSLGAWDQVVSPARVRELQRAERQRQKERAAKQEQHKQATNARRECADKIRLMERVIGCASRRFSQMQQLSSSYSNDHNEAEQCWQIMANAQEIANGLYLKYDELMIREDNFGGIYQTA